MTNTNKKRYIDLHIETYNSNKEMVKLLLEKGADINFQDVHGKTALHFASNEEIVKLLLDNGADVNIKNKNGKTASKTITYFI